MIMVWTPVLNEKLVLGKHDLHIPSPERPD